MPSYSFTCKDCGIKFDVFCSMDEQDKNKCPVCKSTQIQKNWRKSITKDIIYKGHGFYAYDYKRYWGDDIDLK